MSEPINHAEVIGRCIMASMVFLFLGIGLELSWGLACLAISAMFLAFIAITYQEQQALKKKKESDKNKSPV